MRQSVKNKSRPFTRIRKKKDSQSLKIILLETVEVEFAYVVTSMHSKLKLNGSKFQVNC